MTQKLVKIQITQVFESDEKDKIIKFYLKPGQHQPECLRCPQYRQRI